MNKLNISGWFAKGGFKSNFLLTSSGKLIAIGLTLIFTPIFSRIYSPEAYGYFSILNILISHFGIISTLGYSDAILISKEESDVKGLSKISLLLLFFFALVYFALFPLIIQLLVGETKLLNNERVYFAFISIPVLVAVAAIFNKWSEYYNQFRFATLQNSVVNVVVRLAGLAIGLLGRNNLFGLILAEGVGRVFSLATFATKYRSNVVDLLKPLDRDLLKTLLIRYKEFPLFFIPSRYLGLLLNQLPMIFVVNHFSTESLGQLSMAMSLVTYPLALFGNAMAPVFIRRVRDVSPHELKDLVSKLNIWLSLSFLIPVLLSMLLSKFGLHFFLGESWEMAGVLSGVLLVTLIHDVLNVIFGGVYQLKGLQRQMLMINLIFVVVFGLLYYFMQMRSEQLAFTIMLFSILRLCLSSVKCSYLFIKMGLYRAVYINIGVAAVLVIFLINII